MVLNVYILVEELLKNGNQLKKKLGNDAYRVIFIQTDIRVESQVEHLLNTIFEKRKQLDICVNNAGINTEPKNIWETNLGTSVKINNKIIYTTNNDEDPLFNNLYGTFICLKIELKYILKYNNPKYPVNIVNISSANDQSGNLYYPAYTISKSGITNLSKTSAGQVAKYREEKGNKNVPIILINSINPGTTLSPLIINSSNPEALLENKKDIPLDKIARIKEISHTILLFSSYDNTKYMTAGSYYVDGGYSGVANYSNSGIPLTQK